MENDKDQGSAAVCDGSPTLQRAGFKLVSHHSTGGGPIMANVTDLYEKDGVVITHEFSMGGERFSVSAAVRGEALAETNLAAAMLSIPVEVPFEHQGISQRKAYMAGAEQVRAKAAGLVSARASDAPSEPIEQALWDDNGEPMNDAAEKEWRQCNERIRQRATDALDSQPLIRPQPNHPGRWLRGDDGISYPSEQVASSQPTDGGVRNGSEPGRDDEDWFFSPNDGN